MKEEKKVNSENKEKIVTDKYSGESAFSNSELNDELERLAETFRQELKKAQEMSDEEFEEVYADELGIITEDELCACCGERRRDKSFGEHYEYCSECRANMKKYPLGIQGILMVVVFFGLAIFSVITFADDFKCYDYGYKAEKNLKADKIASAITNYDYGIYEFNEKDINAQRMYIKCAEAVFETMDSGVTSMSFVSQLLEDTLTDKQSNSPLYASTMALYKENKLLLATMQEFYTIVENEEYADYEPGNEEMYEKIMADIEAIIEKEVSLVSLDGKTTKMVKASEPMVRFCQYMFAYSSEEYDDSLAYMRLVRELAPDYYWLYGYELGMAELQNGNAEEARSLAKEMMNQNVENPDAYTLHSAVDRMTGKYDNAVSWADKGLDVVEDDAELYRYKAMALVAKGELEQAQEAVNGALDVQKYALGYFTAIVIENELGNDDTVEEYKELLDEQGVEFTDKINNYFKGKITAKQMFTEGTGDVE